METKQLQGTVGSYLSTLVRIGLVERETPATERHPTHTRRSRYRVTDPYLRFYHRFLAPQLPFLLRGAYSAVWNTIEQHGRAFVGAHTFEELCREWIYVAAEQGQLPFLPQQVGSHWGKSEQIDSLRSAHGAKTTVFTTVILSPTANRPWHRR